MNDIKQAVNPIHELDKALHCLSLLMDDCKLEDTQYNKVLSSFINLAEVKSVILKNYKEGK